MSNVQPGDFARVLPPALAAGAIVSVLRAATPQEYQLVASRGRLKAGEPVWACRTSMGTKSLKYDLVESIFAGTPRFAQNYVLPGTEGLCEDSCLRRIDPQADDTAEPRVTETPSTEHA